MTSSCEFCQRTVTQLTTIGEAGGRIEGGQLVPDDEHVSISGPAEGVQTSGGLQLVVTASRTIDGEGQVTDTQEDRAIYSIFNLAREGDTWKLDEILRAED